jgi:hypothetical protein
VGDVTTPYPPVDDGAAVAVRQCAVCGRSVAKVDALLCLEHYRRQRLEAAAQRLSEAQGDVIESMIDLAMNANSEAVRVAAGRDLLDRAGLRRGVEVEVFAPNAASPAEVLRERLARLRSAPDVDGEVVADSETADDPRFS